MRAAIHPRYGSPDVLEIRRVPKPEPQAREVLIKVHATTVSRTDCGMLRPNLFSSGSSRAAKPATLPFLLTPCNLWLFLAVYLEDDFKEE